MEQRNFLAEQGCDHFQGFLFAPPLPIAELDARLRGKLPLSAPIGTAW
jgi:EAL domain-containing protein (putative c-di-GMP-specific phosphodiesterase class I)